MIRVNYRVSVVVLFVLVGILTPTRSMAQAVAIAEVTGTVSDPSGAAVASAQVKMTETDKQQVRTTVTDSQGRYTLPNLPVGPYRLEVQADGFKSYIQQGITLQVGNSVQLNVVLQLGSLSESISVTAAGAMIETKENAVSQVIDQKRIVDLPLNGRQATQLIVLSGAAVTAPGGGMVGSKNYFSSTTISVAGGQANGINYLLDGGDNNDSFTNVNLPIPFPDALQEFSVQTSSLPARFGLHPGAVVNAVTKSGTNAIHGSLFEFLRNGNVNARNFFAPSHDTLKRNQFGGTIGGQIHHRQTFLFWRRPDHAEPQRSSTDHQFCSERPGYERRLQHHRFRQLRFRRQRPNVDRPCLPEQCDLSEQPDSCFTLQSAGARSRQSIHSDIRRPLRQNHLRHSHHRR